MTKDGCITIRQTWFKGGFGSRKSLKKNCSNKKGSRCETLVTYSSDHMPISFIHTMTTNRSFGVCLCICLFTSIYLSFQLFVCLYLRLSVSQSLCLSVCLWFLSFLIVSPTIANLLFLYLLSFFRWKYKLVLLIRLLNRNITLFHILTWAENNVIWYNNAVKTHF